MTDANGHKKDSLADAFGRATRVREYNQGATYTTQYDYDELDRLVDTWDAANNNTHIDYDWLGRKTAMQDPDMGAWSYGYDDAGNLLQQTDAKGNSVCFAYDDLNRVTTKTARSGSDCGAAVSYTVTYGYDDTTNGNHGLGRRTSLTDPGGNASWVYDLQGRVLSTSQSINGAPANPYQTQFTYDAMSRVRAMTYPDGEEVTQSYNAQGLLDTLGSYITASDYNVASELTALTFGNGAETRYTYDPQNLRLTDLDTTQAANVLQDLHYEFDDVGNVLTLTDRGEVTTFQYDDLNRLLSAAVSTGANPYSRGWTYTPIGNMQSRTDGGATTTYGYDDPAHKHAVTSASAQTYGYDANGNMTHHAGDTLDYDIENRLTSVTKAGVVTTFTYNGDGARVKKDVAGIGTTFYIGNIFEVYVPNGGTASTNKYFYFGSQRIAAKIGVDLFYLQSDHLGSTSVVMKDTGDLHTHQTYFPFGETRITEGSPLPTDYTFTGQKNDDSTGLMFYGARYYDVGLGRFLQADTIVPNPADPQSFNRYAYVRNNPANLIDPSGHEEETPACQSWDSWCWENRYWTAQGKCYSEGSGEWTRECAPTISDPEMLAQVATENPNVLLRPDTNVAFDPTGVVKFIWEQMVQNAQGQKAAMLRAWNKCEIANMACCEQVTFHRCLNF